MRKKESTRGKQKETRKKNNKEQTKEGKMGKVSTVLNGADTHRVQN